MMYLKVLDKQEQKAAQSNRWEEIMKIRTKISEREMKEKCR